MDKIAISLVRDYIKKNITNCINDNDYYITWKCYILKNAKYLMGWRYIPGYFEITYDNNKDRWYLDYYKIADKRVIEND